MTKSPMRRPSFIRNLALSSVAAVALIAGSVPAIEGFATTPARADDIAQAAQNHNYDRSYADLVAKVMPSVVSVQVEGVQAPDQTSAPAMDEQQRQFFEKFFGMPMPAPENRPPQKVEGLGSGFVIDSSGYIVTNAHVVNGANKIVVVPQVGDRMPAKLVGIDKKTDLAVIKVDSKQPMQALDWSDSDNVRPGDKIVAVGNPFGLGGTVTSGIVSATGREIGSGPYDDFIQLDAPINRGNSGGPTFDLDGHVIGVNSMIFSPSGGSIGIGFAISSNLAQSVADQLIKSGTVQRGWIGVGIQQMDSDLQQSFGLKDREGALVSQVTPGGPAAKAGVERGDVILSFDHHDISRLTELTRAVADTDPGMAANLVVWRDGKEKTLSVDVGKMPGEQQVASNDQQQSTDQPRLGLALAPLTDDLRSQLGIGDDVKGALVEQVKNGSPAESKGIERGDVIVAIGDTQVDGPKLVVDAVHAAAKNHADTIRMLIARGDAQRWVAVPLATS